MLVFIKNMHEEDLMPCKPQRARKLLKDRKAKILSYKPFTIQLLCGSSGYKQEVHLGVDLGAKHIGLAIVSEDNVLAKGEIELRSDIPSLLETRKSYRRSRRYRKTRYRQTRWENRVKPKGWLPPSTRSRIDNTFMWIDRFAGLLPEAKLHIEVGKFDVQQMMNSDISGEDYQKGKSYGFYKDRYYVFARDGYTCQVCKKKKDKILQTHHIVFKSEGGSNKVSNLITICTDCHTSENHKKGNILNDWMLKKKKAPSYKETPFMNTLRLRIFNKYPEAHITYGNITTVDRRSLTLEKTHYNDAIAITGVEDIKKNKDSIFQIKQFRKKKRSLHEATARKGRKEPNVTQKRNAKNTKCQGVFYLNDKVEVFGQIGFISGFTRGGCYIKDINGEHIITPSKSYKQVSISNMKHICHNNNWQMINNSQKKAIHPTTYANA